MCAWSDSTLTSPPHTRKLEVRIIYCWAWWSQPTVPAPPEAETGRWQIRDYVVCTMSSRAAWQFSKTLQIKRTKVGVWPSESVGAHHLIIRSATVSSKAVTLLSTRQPLTRPFVTPLPYQHSLANYPMDFGHRPGCEWVSCSVSCGLTFPMASLLSNCASFDEVQLISTWFLYFLYFPRSLAEVTKTYCCFF